MTEYFFKGDRVRTAGMLPEIGIPAPDCVVTRTDLSRMKISELRGYRVLLNIFPSLDTPVCAASVRRFNEEASALEQCKVLCVSRDLPFAQQRFCGAEGLKDVMPVSDFPAGEFGRNYGVAVTAGPLEGLLVRAVVVLDDKGTVIYTQPVAEITDEPDYAAALAILH